MNIGFALCGSYCTYAQIFPVMNQLAKKHTLVPIFSQNAYSTDSRFGTAKDHIQTVADICGKAPLHTIAEVEPIGPKKLLDALVIAPCTGNTLAKLAHSIADTSVTMAAKSHLRNGRPVLIAVSTNDALAGAAENIGRLLGRRNYYFVPFRQDDAVYLRIGKGACSDAGHLRTAEHSRDDHPSRVAQIGGDMCLIPDNLESEITFRRAGCPLGIEGHPLGAVCAAAQAYGSSAAVGHGVPADQDMALPGEMPRTLGSVDAQMCIVHGQVDAAFAVAGQAAVSVVADGRGSRRCGS